MGVEKSGTAIGRRGVAGVGLALLGGCSPAQVLNATVPDDGVEKTADVAFGPGARDRLDVYRPTFAGGGLPLVVFLYGGSWRSGSKGIYGFVGRPLARRGVVVVVPDYRLYPEVRYPAFLEDNARAVAWAFANAERLGADPRRVVLMGHSAGAFNAMMLALDPAWLGAARLRLTGAVGLAGPYRFLPSTDPEVVPVFGADNTPSHEPYAFARESAPPLFLAAGTADQTVQPRNTVELAAAVRAHGGVVVERLYQGVGHVGLITAFAPVFQGRAPVLAEVSGFVWGAGTGGLVRPPSPGSGF